MGPYNFAFRYLITLHWYHIITVCIGEIVNITLQQGARQEQVRRLRQTDREGAGKPRPVLGPRDEEMLRIAPERVGGPAGCQVRAMADEVLRRGLGGARRRRPRDSPGDTRGHGEGPRSVRRAGPAPRQVGLGNASQESQ